jgi:3D (Asp-Asp-Asp) domain-containing protein
MNTAVAPAKIAKSQVISLVEAEVNETTLEKLIADDPSILGLGDVVLIERQRIQERAGRLDLLLEDAEGEVRYEVELMVGSLDETTS